jgi:hypothetical protein
MTRKYVIFIDENLPQQLAEGLNILQQPLNLKEGVEIEIKSIKKEFGQGEQDEDWIPKVGKLKGIVITQDTRIQSQKHQKELYQKEGVGMLFMSAPSKTGWSYWEMVKQLIERWDEIKTIVIKNKPPFAFRCSARTKFEKLD